MTTAVKITNRGTHAIVVNVWETASPMSEGENVQRIDLQPGEESPSITIYGWRRGVTVLEAAATESTPS